MLACIPVAFSCRPHLANYPFLYTSHGYELSSDATASTKAFSQTSEPQKLEILRKHQKVAACNEETASEESDFCGRDGKYLPLSELKFSSNDSEAPFCPIVLRDLVLFFQCTD